MVKFKAGDAVFAYHGPLIYEAKILKVHEKNKSYVELADGKQESLENAKVREDLLNVDIFFLHYQRWKSKWDEWVTIDRLLEFNEENKQVKREMDEATRRKKVVVKKEPTPLSSTSNDDKSTHGRKRPSTDKNSKDSKKRKENPKPEIIIEMEPELKYILVDDWEFITKERQVTQVPCEYPVSRILKEYETYQKKSARSSEVLLEFLNGLEIYFNKSLSLVLLYKSERLQYLNIIKLGYLRNSKQSDLYGVIHLLRLFVSLPGMISRTTMDPISIGVLIQESQEILKFIVNNLSKYIVSYENTSPNYDSLARS